MMTTTTVVSPPAPTEFQVRDVGGSGTKGTADRGVFATVDMPRGHVFYAERPYVCVGALFGADVATGQCAAPVAEFERRHFSERERSFARNVLTTVDCSLAFYLLCRLRHDDARCRTDTDFVRALLKLYKFPASRRLEDHKQLEDARAVAAHLGVTVRTVILALMCTLDNMFRVNELFTRALANGLVLYEGAATRFNHSCAPNVEYVIDAQTWEVVFTTTRRVTAGSQLSICYVFADVSRITSADDVLCVANFDCACREHALLFTAREVQRNEQRARSTTEVASALRALDAIDLSGTSGSEGTEAAVEQACVVVRRIAAASCEDVAHEFSTAYVSDTCVLLRVLHVLMRLHRNLDAETRYALFERFEPLCTALLKFLDDDDDAPLTSSLVFRATLSTVGLAATLHFANVQRHLRAVLANHEVSDDEDDINQVIAQAMQSYAAPARFRAPFNALVQRFFRSGLARRSDTTDSAAVFVGDMLGNSLSSLIAGNPLSRATPTLMQQMFDFGRCCGSE